MIYEYKRMTEGELEANLRLGHIVVEKTKQRITEVLPTKQGSAYAEERIDIKEWYSIIKGQLKILYYYTTLARNASPSNSYYTRILIPAVYYAYEHCSARTTANDMNKLLQVLNDVSDDIQYYLLYADALANPLETSALLE